MFPAPWIWVHQIVFSFTFLQCISMRKVGSSSSWTLSLRYICQIYFLETRRYKEAQKIIWKIVIIINVHSQRILLTDMYSNSFLAIRSATGSKLSLMESYYLYLKAGSRTWKNLYGLLPSYVLRNMTVRVVFAYFKPCFLVTPNDILRYRTILVIAVWHHRSLLVRRAC